MFIFATESESVYSVMYCVLLLNVYGD